MFVQAFGTNDNTAGTSLSTASTAVTGTGTLIVAVSVDSSGGVAPITVSDGVNGYVQIGTTQNDATNNQCLALFIANNITGGTRAITASFASGGGRIISVLEFSGCTTAALGQAGLRLVASGATTPDGDLSSSATVAVSDDVVGVILQTGAPVGTFSAGTGFVLRNTQSPGPVLATESRTRASSGSISATFTDTATGAYIAGIVTLTSAFVLGPPPTLRA